MPCEAQLGQNEAMRLGLHALGIGSGADPEIIQATAVAAEAAELATLWAGEHVVMVDRADTRYPYADDGRIAVPSNADWLDPLLALSFAAATTTSIRLATGVLLLPQHNPLVVAKQAATLDVLSKGRFVLGVGIGWSREEFTALGVPFGGRADRTRESVEVMRALWRDDVASFDGETVHFCEVRSYPKPVRDRRLPVFLEETATRHWTGWPPMETAGTGSIWPAPRWVSGSPPCESGSGGPVAIPTRWPPPSRCVTGGPRTSAS